MLTRAEFNDACKHFITKDATLATDGIKGWSWNEHPSFSGFGYMSRTTCIQRKSGALDLLEDLHDGTVKEDEDNAVVDHTSAPPEILNARQYVVYSPTFRVPAFYFTVHDKQGSPLSLNDLVNTSLFRASSLAGTETTPFGLSQPDTSFPLLSQGDHPTLGTPCWYLHPCETGAAVSEIMREIQQEGWSDDQRLVRWMEAWFMVLSTVVCVGCSLSS